MPELITQNKNGFDDQPIIVPSSGVQIEQAKVIQQVQASLLVAKKFPRDENLAYAKIIKACERPFLAEQSTYAFPRGKNIVTGPSIRLAEVIQQNWGNIYSGIEEISREIIMGKVVSQVRAFAWDLETNTMSEIKFSVTHWRNLKDGDGYAITDERDIYELVANQGARRKRSCILAIIPGDITEAAVEKCKQTLASGTEPLSERVRKLIILFDELGVKIEHLEKRLGHKLDAVIETEMVTLRAVYKSIRDGVASRENFFDFGAVSSEVSKSKSSQLNKKLEPNPNQDFLDEMDGKK